MQQIEAILQQARMAGLSQPEVDGLHDALLMRVAQPDLATKLRLSIAMLPQTQTDTIDAFVGEAVAIGQDTLQRGRAELDALSDDEWEALVQDAQADDSQR